MSFVDFRQGLSNYRLTNEQVCYAGITLPALAADRAAGVFRAALAGPTPVLSTRIRAAFPGFDGGRAGSPATPPAMLPDRLASLVRQGRLTLYDCGPDVVWEKSVGGDAPVPSNANPDFLSKVWRVVTGLKDVTLQNASSTAQASFKKIVDAMVSMPALAGMMVFVFVGWVASQATGVVGLVIDAALLGIAIASLGLSAFGWFERLGKFVGSIRTARSDEDFKRCSETLATLIIEIGVDAFITLLLRAAGRKAGQMMAKDKPALRTAAPRDTKMLPPGKPQAARPVPEANKPIPLNPGVNITPKGLKHVVDRHVPGGPPKWSDKSKFNTNEDPVALIRATTQQPMILQTNGNYARVVDLKRPIGLDKNTGQQSTMITVITKPDGELVTAFPGNP